jgi:hypothetical protein
VTVPRASISRLRISQRKRPMSRASVVLGLVPKQRQLRTECFNPLRWLRRQRPRLVIPARGSTSPSENIQKQRASVVSGLVPKRREYLPQRFKLLPRWIDFSHESTWAWFSLNWCRRNAWRRVIARSAQPQSRASLK